MTQFLLSGVFWKKITQSHRWAPLINSAFPSLENYPLPFSISSYFKRCLFSQVPFLTTSLLILAEFTAIFGKNRGNKVRISPTLCPLQMRLATYTPDSHPVDEASILPAQGSPLHLTASSMHTGPRYVCLAHHCSLCIQHSACHQQIFTVNTLNLYSVSPTQELYATRL